MGTFGNDRRGGGFSRGGGRSFGRDRGFSRGSDRQMFKTTCSNCGKDCEVPFRPTNGKPVYCSDCFEKMGNTRDESTPRFVREDRPQRHEQPQVNYSAQFEALNVKLDKIITLLEPKVVEVSIPDIVVEESTPKIKKIASKKK